MYFSTGTLILTVMIFLSCTNANASVSILSAKECANMQTRGTITSSNPVSCDRLRRVNFRHVNFNGVIKTGNIVVLDSVAEQVEGIFSELFKQRFPIHKAVVIEHYQGNDEASMVDNNTSDFNGRSITGGASWSKHAYGVAIDINPLQNPYISYPEEGSANILPPSSSKFFVNRNNNRPNKKQRVGMAENVIDVFARHGFIIWGGDWDTPIDYQHFEVGSYNFIHKLINQSPDSARQMFNQYVNHYNDCISKHIQKDYASKRTICINEVRQ